MYKKILRGLASIATEFENTKYYDCFMYDNTTLHQQMTFESKIQTSLQNNNPSQQSA